jgi:hypothetical protein
VSFLGAAASFSARFMSHFRIFLLFNHSLSWLSFSKLTAAQKVAGSDKMNAELLKDEYWDLLALFLLTPLIFIPLLHSSLLYTGSNVIAVSHAFLNFLMSKHPPHRSNWSCCHRCCNWMLLAVVQCCCSFWLCAGHHCQASCQMANLASPCSHSNT